MNKQEIYDLLIQKNIPHEITEHEAVYSMAEVAMIELPHPEAEAKNLFIRDDKKQNFYLITVKGDKRVDLKQFRKDHSTRALHFVSAELLMDILGLIPGAVTPMGAGGKFDDSAYKTSGGLHGVGSSVVNALSNKLTVRVKKNGCIYEDKYEKGIPTIELVDGLLPVIGKTRETGTSINFLPDDTIFDKTRFKEDEVKSRLHETAYLNPKLTIIYEDKRKSELEYIEFHEPEGLIGFLKDLNKSKETIHDVVYYSGESEGISVEAAFQYVNEFHETVLGFCNNIYNAEGGTHLTGFKTMFTTVINTYARELNILKEKDVNFTGADIRNGMTAVVSIKHPDPRFEGQHSGSPISAILARI